jgi:hypothetical protein
MSLFTHIKLDPTGAFDFPQEFKVAYLEYPEPLAHMHSILIRIPVTFDRKNNLVLDAPSFVHITFNADTGQWNVDFVPEKEPLASPNEPRQVD